MNGSDLFHRVMALQPDDETGRLMCEVWSGTPWVVDAYTGNITNYGRYREVMDWCRNKFGPEAWPIHGKPGQWHHGGVTINGWTWMGFATKEMMDQFIEQWGNVPSEIKAGGA